MNAPTPQLLNELVEAAILYFDVANCDWIIAFQITSMLVDRTAVARTNSA